jgi:DNA helicase MCM9
VFFTLQRRQEAGGNESGRTTLRFLESLIRVSKAHARLMGRRVVSVQDAVVAVGLVELSMNSSQSLGPLHVGFARDPDAAAAFEVEETLQKLNLRHLLPAKDRGTPPSPTPAAGLEEWM